MDLRRVSLLAPLCILAGAFAACSGASTSGFTDGDGGSNDGSHSDASRDHFGGGGDDGGFNGDGGGGDDSGGPAYGGYVDGVSYSYTSGGQPIRGGSFGAGFARPTGGSVCTLNRVAPCDVFECTTSTVDAGALTYASAGDVSITGGTQSVTVSPGSNGSYTFKNTTTVLWNGGETLTMRASGGEVPAFSGTVRAPTTATITVPSAPPAGQSLVINRASFGISWSGGSGSMVYLQLGRSSSSTQSVMLQCVFDGSAGSASIPPAAMAYITPGSSGYLAAYTRNTTPVIAGSWAITLQALMFALTQAGGPYSVQATFQ
jgi:hypothetical protein